MKSPSARRPVFLDSTGRRHRTIRRAGAFLAVPAVGYLILLVSSLLGGPSLDTPLVPLPEAAKPAPRPVVTPAPEAVQSVRPGEATTSPESTSTPSSGPTSTPTTPSATPTVVQTTVAPTPTTGSPTTTPGKPTTANTSNRPTAPPGRTKSPSKP